jgi:cobalt-zinc-cadmium efflux system protein
MGGRYRNAARGCTLLQRPVSKHHHGHADHGPHHHAEHDHAHLRADDSDQAFRRLASAFALTASFLLVEAGVGVWSKSLALLADAGHMLADAVALGLALLAQRIAQGARTRARTYGSRRAEVLAAFANGVALVLTSLWIVGEAVTRLLSPEVVSGSPMLLTACLGLVVNLAAAALLTRGQGAHNINTRAALAHVLSDAAGSVGAIVAGLLVLQFGWNRADPAIGVAIAGLVFVSGLRLVRSTSSVLMEGTPFEIDVAGIEETLRGVVGVADFHDLHVWSISDGFHVLTVHVVVAPGHHGIDVVAAVSRALRERHGITHVTIQPEATPDPGLVVLRARPRSEVRAS